MSGHLHSASIPCLVGSSTLPSICTLNPCSPLPSHPYSSCRRLHKKHLPVPMSNRSSRLPWLITLESLEPTSLKLPLPPPSNGPILPRRSSNYSTNERNASRNFAMGIGD